jgi:hypothetical protein
LPSSFSLHPRLRNPFPIELFFRSCGDYGTFQNGPKTYGRFLGMIFFGGVGPALVAQKQGFAAGKIPKNMENTKKSAK